MRRRTTIRAVGLALAFLLTSGCAASSVSSGPEDLVGDKSGLALNKQRLAVVAHDLNAVIDPANARAKAPAYSSGCTLDSGEVFEPSAGRSWSLSGPAKDNTDPESVDAQPLTPTLAGRHAMEQIATQLIALGWIGSARVRHLYAHEKHSDGIYVIELQRTFPDHQVHLGIQGFSDSILAEARTTPKHVCNHRS
jgi:hypothetical protein